MTAPLFQVGEIVEITGADDSRLLGEDAAIVGPLALRRVQLNDGRVMEAQMYLIEVGGVRLAAHQQSLRKKRPPMGDWSALRDVWQPQGIRS